MDYIERLSQDSKGNKSSSAAGKKKKSGELSKQKWAILSLSSIPLVMTLGNSMLIPVLTFNGKEIIDYRVPNKYDYNRLFDSSNFLNPGRRLFIRSYRQKKSNYSKSHYSWNWRFNFRLGRMEVGQCILVDLSRPCPSRSGSSWCYANCPSL